MSLMWIPAQTTQPPFADAVSAAGTSSPAAANTMAASSSSGGRSSEPPAHSAPSSQRERLAVGVSGSSEREDAPPFGQRELADDVRGGTEAVQPDALRSTGQRVRAVADQPCAEQGCGLHVRVAVRDGKAVTLVGDGLLREATVDVVAGEARLVAEVLAAADAEAAPTAGPGEPGDADPLALVEACHALSEGVDGADDLMPEDERQLRPLELAVDDVEVRAADTAGTDVEADGTGTRLGTRDVALDEPLPDACEDDRSHARPCPPVMKAAAVQARHIVAITPSDITTPQPTGHPHKAATRSGARPVPAHLRRRLRRAVQDRRTPRTGDAEDLDPADCVTMAQTAAIELGHGVRLEPQGWAPRLGRALHQTRTARDVSLRALARESNGRFTTRDLRQFEQGARPAGELLSRLLADLYQLELEEIVPERSALDVDLGAGVITTGGATVSLAPVPDPVQATLTAYLDLVWALRGVKGGQVALRTNDVLVLADVLALDEDVVVDGLADLMQCSRGEARTLVAALRRHTVIVPVSALLVLGAGAGLSSTVSGLLFPSGASAGASASSLQLRVDPPHHVQFAPIPSGGGTTTPTGGLGSAGVLGAVGAADQPGRDPARATREPVGSDHQSPREQPLANQAPVSSPVPAADQQPIDAPIVASPAVDSTPTMPPVVDPPVVGPPVVVPPVVGPPVVVPPVVGPPVLDPPVVVPPVVGPPVVDPPVVVPPVVGPPVVDPPVVGPPVVVPPVVDPPVAGPPVVDPPVVVPPVVDPPTDPDRSLVGTKKADVLIGGSGKDTIDGGAGNDTIDGGAGNDRISGGTGNDKISGGTGDDLIDGGAGNDTIDGGAGNDRISGGTGNDKISGGTGDDLIDGGAGNDTIDGGAGNDRISGGTGNDKISGGTGDDLIDGGAGNDNLSGGGGDDTIVGGDGNDVLEGGDGNDTLLGGNGNDRLTGGAGGATAYGGAGNDTYFTTDGAKDVFIGGSGKDRVVGNIEADDEIDLDGLDAPVTVESPAP